jgi:hypothetical protein
MSGMGEMMTQPQKQFYPSLMNMPTLSPEARQSIEREAQRRLGTGAEAISAAAAGLRRAMSQQDLAAIQEAAARVREGLLQVESGTEALRAVSEGQHPHQIALTWFKGQLSIPSTNEPAAGPGLLSLSWFHLTAMIFLGIFVVGSLCLRFARMRRISALVQRLANRSVP